MRFIQTIPALFATWTLAANWEGFHNVSCQRYLGDYKLLTLEEQKELIVSAWNKTTTQTEASRAFSPRGACPSNSDDTFKWIHVPQWNDQPTRWGRPMGGAIAVVYFKETDTYHNCAYLSSAQQDGYKGLCDPPSY